MSGIIRGRDLLARVFLVQVVWIRRASAFSAELWRVEEL